VARAPRVATVRSASAVDFRVNAANPPRVLKGEKRQEKEEKDENYHFSARACGSFQRSFQLPSSVDRDKIAGDFSKGVLTITLPKTAAAQKPQKKIEIKSA